MSNKNTGPRTVDETAAILKVNKSRISQITKSALRKLRWSAHFKQIKEFIDEYNTESSYK